MIHEEKIMVGDVEFRHIWSDTYIIRCEQDGREYEDVMTKNDLHTFVETDKPLPEPAEVVE